MTFEELKEKMPQITGFLLTRPDLQDDRVTEVWIKFRNDGFYVFINLEQPLPRNIEPIKLVGAGNALDCSDYKKDNELIQYNEKMEILSVLGKSKNYRNNLIETVQKIEELINIFSERFLHY